MRKLTEKEKEMAQALHDQEIKDSDGQVGSTIAIDPNWIDKEIERLRNK